MLTVILGLIGLGIIICVHEYGHFIAARLAGVSVESFSVGMGPVLLRKKIGETEFRLSLIPFGGYCSMKGEKDFQRAVEEKLKEIPADKNSFYGVHPFKRLLIAFCGPLFNCIFAVIAFTVIAMIGYSYRSSGTKILLASEDPALSAAAGAGLKTGDSILSIDGKPMRYFSDIPAEVALRSNEIIRIRVRRDAADLDFDVPVQLEKSSGAGRIGVMAWIDPVIEAVAKDSAAEAAGLGEGDAITAIDGVLVGNTEDVRQQLQGKTVASLTVSNGGRERSVSLVPRYDKNNNLILGIQFQSNTVDVPGKSLFPAIAEGFRETGSLFAVSLKSIALLFQGVDVTQAVSGPVRITVMLGEVVKSGFAAGFAEGLVSALNFLALISISLFIMNLLPVPVLDGGIILFALIQIIRRKQTPPLVLYRIQFFGFAFILGLLCLALFSDFTFLFRR